MNQNGTPRYFEPRPQQSLENYLGRRGLVTGIGREVSYQPLDEAELRSEPTPYP